MTTPRGSAVRPLLAVVIIHVAMVCSEPSPGMQEGDEEGWKLSSHTFEETLNYDTGLGNWLMSAATMSLRNRMQLMPMVPDRYGLFWNKRAVKSRDFEVLTNFVASQRSAQADGSFAYWLSPANFSATYNEQKIITKSKKWRDGLTEAGLTFLSNTPRFHGLVVAFLTVGGERKISAIWSDGNRNMDEVTLSSDAAAKRFDWSAGKLWLKMALNPRGRIEVRVLANGADGLGEVFSHGLTVPGTIAETQDEWYFGWSGYSGEKHGVSVDINTIVTRNRDEKKIGEEAVEGMHESNEEWRTVLEQEKRFIDQAAQKDAIDRLTLLLERHVAQYVETGTILKTELLSIDTRMTELEKEMQQMALQVEAYNPQTHHLDASAVKQHMKGLHSLLHNDSAISKLHEASAMAHDIKKAGSLEAAGRDKIMGVSMKSVATGVVAAQGSSQLNSLLGILILVVGCLGCLFLNRMRYYEKKHYI